jgi:hypothetical protein
VHLLNYAKEQRLSTKKAEKAREYTLARAKALRSQTM